MTEEKTPKRIKEVKRGRPSTGFDKRAYMKEYMRKKRVEKKRNSVTNSNDGE